MNNEIYDLFRDLSDSDDQFMAEGDTIIFTHHGGEHILSVAHVPGIGPAMRRKDTEESWIAVTTFIQKEILKLPVLAKQVLRALQRKHQEQKIKGFIDGPSQIRDSDGSTEDSSAKSSLEQFLTTPNYGSTQVIELMAPAGQGKSVLLEHLAIEAAKSYQPDPYPFPLLLVVDLLGRYVGTIHDAIAGSLSNSYIFPGLTGRDVSFCLRQRWLNLALDGFDELVARVGNREAFLRAKELIDDLEGSGTVILSARDTFFDLYEVDASIRTYLQPRKGTYDIKAINLKSWGRTQGRRIFELLEASDPDQELSNLLQTFHEDTEIVFRPFFTTRLATAWLEGERFNEIGEPGEKLDRWNYVIRVFLEREATEKWRSRDDSLPLLDIDGHVAMLGSLAEEMWRSNAFTLTKEEVELAGQVGLNDLGLSPSLVDDLVKRLPTHGVLSPAGEKGVKFIHDNFFTYLLGQRLGRSISCHDTASVEAILQASELSPLCVEWATWRVKKEAVSIQQSLQWLLTSTAHKRENVVLSGNVANLLGSAARHGQISDLSVDKVEFFGDALKETKLSSIVFNQCSFWVVDLCGAVLTNCTFNLCKFGKVLLDENTRFDGSSMSNPEFSEIELKDQTGFYSPTEIASLINRRGASIENDTVIRQDEQQASRQVQREVIVCLDKMRRAKTWDVAVEDIEEKFGDLALEIVRLGVEANVLREINRDTSGGKKDFVRFTVDRERLYSGQLGKTGQENIDRFWDSLVQELPS